MLLGFMVANCELVAWFPVVFVNPLLPGCMLSVGAQSMRACVLA